MTNPKLLKTKGFPLVGSLPSILRKQADFFIESRNRYGDIYQLDLGLMKMIGLNHPDHVKHVLVNNASNYLKQGPLWKSAQTLLGNGLVTSEGEFWRQQRRMMQPYFSKNYLSGLTDLLVQTIDESIVPWDNCATSGQALNMVPAAEHIVTNVMFKAVFGSLTRQETNEIRTMIKYAMDYIVVGMLAIKVPNWVPLPGKNRYQQTLKTLDKTVLKFIAQYRETNTHSGGLLSKLIEATDDKTDEQMTDAQLLDEAITLFIAGIETTATAMAWTVHCLMQHPEVLSQLHAEIDDVLQGKPPTSADLSNLNYTRWVIQESLRRYPSVYWFPRQAQKADEIDGVPIAAGSNVALLIYAIHHHPDFWETPLRFDPERFTSARSANRHPQAWIPFGAGQRKCIGEAFAIMGLQLALARMLQQYDITPIPGHITKPKLRTTMRPGNGVWVNLKKRT